MTILPPDPPPRRRLNMWAIVLAVVVAAAVLPFTFRHEEARVMPEPAKKAWRMSGINGITQTKALERFGKPVSARDYKLTEGSFAGPLIGQKHYLPLNAPDYAERIADAQVVWSYPAYSTVRELIWKMPDSYLTIWLQQPRAEMVMTTDTDNVTLPDGPPGEWVALDNFRVGNALVTNSRAAQGAK